MTDRIPLDHLTSDALDQLYDALDHVRHIADLIEAGAPWTANHQDTARRLHAALDTDTTGHRYLSTGCLHNEHDYCSNVDGIAGLKKPAQCKFCTAPCICPCHTGTPAPSATQATDDVKVLGVVPMSDGIADMYGGWPREHCGDLMPAWVIGPRSECVLPPGHQGSHADDRCARWWYDPLSSGHS